MSRERRTYAIDFDGVLHQYDGYKNGLIRGPIEGAREAVVELLDNGHEVVVFTTRDALIVNEWLAKHDFPKLEVTQQKRPFWLIIDDRAMPFDGSWDGMVQKALDFEPYWVRRRKKDPIHKS